MNVRKFLGKRIKELRIKKHMNQSELSELIGVEPRSISRIESGFHFPKDEHLEKFAKAFRVEIKDLFDFSHLDNKEYIIEINNILPNANKEDLKIIYKIIKSIVN